MKALSIVQLVMLVITLCLWQQPASHAQQGHSPRNQARPSVCHAGQASFLMKGQTDVQHVGPEHFPKADQGIVLRVEMVCSQGVGQRVAYQSTAFA